MRVYPYVRTEIHRSPSGALPAPVWVVRRRRDKPGFVVRRIRWERFLEYARRDRWTIAILKHEADARAYRDRLQQLQL